VVAEMSLQTVNQIVGMALVGRLGAASVAAIGLSMQPLFFAMALFTGISVGTTALIARFTGAGDVESANSVLNLSTLWAGFLAVLVGLVGFRYGPQLIAVMGGDPEVQLLGGQYLRSYAAGLGLMLLLMVLSAGLRGAGDTRTPMYANVLTAATNIPLTYAGVYGLPMAGVPAMGVAGAGLARTISTVLGGTVLLWALLGGKKVLRLRPRELLRPDWTLTARTLKVGIPAALERVVMSLGQLVYVRQVSALGTTAYAAHAIAVNAESLSYMPGFGFATSATTLVGQNLGAGRPDRATWSGWESWKLGAMVMGGMGVMFALFPAALMRIYTDDPEIIRLGAMCLRLVALSQVPMAAGFIFPGALRGAGDTRSVLAISAAGVWLVRLGLTFLCVRVLGLGLLGAWIAMVADWFFRGAVLARRFLAGKWQNLEI
jgi:putative MATE family efflux protein